MLYKLNFNIEEMNKNDGSVTYQKEEGVVYGLSNPAHPMWTSFEEKEPMVVFVCKEIEPGIYQSGLNFEYEISSYSDMESYASYEPLNKEGKPIESKDWKDIMEGISPYGVADNIDQIKERFKDMIDSDNPLIISVTEMKKKNQPEDGGWRWHKWGEYIGKQEPQSEYLYDEPNIDSVYVFHVYAIRPKMEKIIKEDITKSTKPKM